MYQLACDRNIVSVAKDLRDCFNQKCVVSDVHYQPCDGLDPFQGVSFPFDKCLKIHIFVFKCFMNSGWVWHSPYEVLSKDLASVLVLIVLKSVDLQVN